MSPLDVSSSPNQRWLAKEFANSFEQSHRSIPHEVHAYVEFAKHLSETAGPEPDPSFRAALRHRLLHELIEDELIQPPDELAMRREQRTARRKGGAHCFERSPREPWIAAASTVLVVCGGAVGLGHESSQALPGDSLYPVKRFFESGELAMANSADGQARELMEQASERLAEASELATIDEIHAEQALPQTIVEFSEAAGRAGNIVLEQSRVDTSASTVALVSEYRSFSSTSRTMLDEIATTADGETAALIDQAHATLDGIEQLLPILDSVLDAAEQLPVASDGLNLVSLGGSDNADGLSETAVEPFDGELVDTIGDDDTLSEAAAVVPDLLSDVDGVVAPVGESVTRTIDDATETLTTTVNDATKTLNEAAKTLTATLDGATTTLTNTVSVVELSNTEGVSMALATVNHTVQQTTAAVDQTVGQTVDTVDQTLDTLNDTVQQTLDAPVPTADETVDEPTVEEPEVDSVQQTIETVQATSGSGDAPTISDVTGGLDDMTDDTLAAATGDLLVGQSAS